jgi:hypothetical protein
MDIPSDFDEKLKQRMDKLPECPICYGKMDGSNKIALQCGHELHKNCLARWSGNPKNERDRHKTCPICRAPLEIKRETGHIRRNDETGESVEIGGKRRRKTKGRKTKGRKTKGRKTKGRKTKGRKTKRN